MSEHTDAGQNTPEGRAFTDGVKAERARVLHALLHSIPVTHDGYASIEELEAAIDLPPAEEDGLLTVAEHAVVEQAGALWGAICKVVEDDRTRSSDLAELIAHVHAIQHAVMANAAARAYPGRYRPLGGIVDARNQVSAERCER